MEEMTLLAILFIVSGIGINVTAVIIGRKPATAELPNPHAAQTVVHVVGMVSIAIGAVIIALT